MEQWTDVRRAVLVEKISKRAACRRFGIHWQTLERILRYPVPPGYLRKQAAAKAVIAPWLGRLKELIEANRDLPLKQRYTVKRMWDVLFGEGFTGGYTTVKDAVRELRQQAPKEVFMPLSQPPGEVRAGPGPVHYLSLLDRKPGSLDHGRPFAGWDLPEDFAVLRRRLEGRREDGTREYIRVLLLLRDYPLERVALALGQALGWTAPTADAIKQWLLPCERPELKTFRPGGNIWRA